MSHWHVPTAKEAANRWTYEEWERAVKLRASGLGYEDIGIALGRARKAVRAKFAKETLTPTQRQARADYDRRKREENTASLRRVAGIPTEFSVKRPTAELLRERDYRSGLQHRDLTAAFFGDPLPGMSALDKRGQV